MREFSLVSKIPKTNGSLKLVILSRKKYMENEK